MSRLRRRYATRTPVARIVVVTEGISTEPGYLKAFYRIYGNRSSAKIVPIGVAGDPLSVVKRAIKETTKVRHDHLGMRDSVWAMFDQDDHPHFEEAKKVALKYKIQFVVSNPCFELWGILHYRYHDAPDDCDKCQRILEGICQSYDRSRGKLFADEQAIRDGYFKAVKRAKKLLGRRIMQRCPGGNPSTTIHELTEHIRLFPEN